MSKDFIHGEAQGLAKRSISQKTCKKLRYEVGVVPEDSNLSTQVDGEYMRWAGKKVQIANYYSEDGKTLVGQKLRDKDKNFAVVGKVSGALFGQHAAPAGGKVLVIVGGEIDVLSYAEARENWPVVSPPTGEGSLKKAIKDNLTYIESFDKVVIQMDNDEAGREAVEKCKDMITPGKCHIGALSDVYKDFNEALVEGDIKAILHAVFQAETVKPDGIVDIDDIIEDAMKPVEYGLPWFLPWLTEKTYGRRYSEVYGLGGPTGGGKTDFFTEQIAYDVETLKLPVGVLMLEQKPTETAKRIAGKVGNQRYHVPDAGWTSEGLRADIMKLQGKVTFYDSFGQTEWDRIRNAIRHMNIGKGIRIFYVDHLTAMADTSDEKGSLEQIMKEMAGIANELNVIIHFISHLTTPDGTPHEEGGRIMIRHFKGSRSIGFWSYFMFGLERDQQAEDEIERRTTTLRILKDRYTGQSTGCTFELGYDDVTGRIIPKEIMDMPHFQDTTKDEEF